MKIWQHEVVVATEGIFTRSRGYLTHAGARTTSARASWRESNLLEYTDASECSSRSDFIALSSKDWGLQTRPSTQDHVARSTRCRTDARLSLRRPLRERFQHGVACYAR